MRVRLNRTFVRDYLEFLLIQVLLSGKVVH